MDAPPPRAPEITMTEHGTATRERPAAPDSLHCPPWLAAPEIPSERPVPRVFIGGCERSGTTFLAAQISRWTGLTFLPEAYFLLGVLRKLESAPGVARDLILNHWRFRTWNLDVEALRRELSEKLSAGACMNLLAERYTHSLGMSPYKGWIEHTPFNTAHVHLLDRHFEDSRYINIVRDGRAVAASILRTDFGPTTIRSAAAWWQAHVLPGILAQWHHPGRVLLVRYEDLIMNPERSKARILAFLGHGPAEAAGKIRVDPYWQATHELVEGPADRSRIEAWKQSLRAKQIEIFESLTAGSLTGLGYELTGTAAIPSHRALRYCDQMVDSLRQALWQFPLRTLRRFRSGTRRKNGTT